MGTRLCDLLKVNGGLVRVDIDGGDVFELRILIVREISFWFVAKSKNVEVTVGVENGLEFFSKPGTVGSTKGVWNVAEIEILCSA